MRLKLRSSSFIFCVFLLSCIKPTHPKEIVDYYLDNNFPDSIPKVYAPQILSLASRFEQNISISADGKEHFFTETNSSWNYKRILRVRKLKDSAIALDTLNFSNEFIGEPRLSIDGKKLYFVGIKFPPDIWYANRGGEHFLNPVRMDSINSTAAEWYPSFSKKGTMYFASESVKEGRIFSSQFVDGKYATPKIVDGLFNKAQAGDPCISPNEDYLIYLSMRENGYGQGDLYVTFKKPDGTWTDGYNLGGNINTENFEFAPSISPDGKFLFFSRRDKWQNAVYSDIYWVRLDVIEKFKKRKSVIKIIGHHQL